MAINPALIGKAGEMLVAAEIMRRGVEVAHPASDVGVDLLAYRLGPKQTVSSKFVPIQVKARSALGYNFHKIWFKVPGVVLVYVWHVATKPVFYIFDNVARVEQALGQQHVLTESWQSRGAYTANKPSDGNLQRMQCHVDRWERIINQLSAVTLLALVATPAWADSPPKCPASQETFISYTPMPERFLIQMEYATQTQVQSAMDATGCMGDSGLHYLSDAVKWGGAINFTFKNDKVIGIAAQVEDFENPDPDYRGIRYIWNFDVGVYCSDFPNARSRTGRCSK